jgi:hypothetical protein
MALGSFGHLILAFVGQLPVVLVLLIGFILALVRRPQHPKAATLAAVGCGVLLLNLLAGYYVETTVVPSLVGGGTSIAEVGRIVMFIGIARSVVMATGLGLLIGAIFAGRR